MTGSGSGHGVEVDGTGNPVTNVTVERLHANEWTVGVFVLGVDDSTVENVVVNGTISGVALAQSGGNRILDVTAYDNSIGVAVGGESNNNTVRNALAVENKWQSLRARERQQRRAKQHRAQQLELGLLLDAQSRAERGLEPRALDGHVSFTEQNVAFRAITDPPALPAGTANRNAYVQIFAAAGQSTVSMTMGDGSGSGSATPWRATDDSSSPRQGTSDSGSVSAENLTEFGVFAALSDSGSGGTTNVTTSQSPSVQRAMTTVPGDIERRHHERRDGGRHQRAAVGSNTTADERGRRWRVDGFGRRHQIGRVRGDGGPRRTGAGRPRRPPKGAPAEAGGLLSSSLGLAKVLLRALASLSRWSSSARFA